MQEAVEREGAGWRDRTTSLEADLAKMESDAREALRRAEEVCTETSICPTMLENICLWAATLVARAEGENKAVTSPRDWRPSRFSSSR